MVSERRHQAVGSLCVSAAPCSRRLPPADQAHQLPAARGPPCVTNGKRLSGPIHVRTHPSVVLQGC
jgi:hypothetical protein